MRTPTPFQRIARPAFTCICRVVFAPVAGHGGGADRVRVQFRELETMFAKPGQGWMSQQRSPRASPVSPAPSCTSGSTGADAEPERGQFDWKLIDDVIAAWRPRGAAVALRVMSCNATAPGTTVRPSGSSTLAARAPSTLWAATIPPAAASASPVSSPITRTRLPRTAWCVPQSAGRTLRWSPGGRIPRHRFLRHLGEWHTKNPAPVAVRKQIVDLYLRALPPDAARVHVRRCRGVGLRVDPGGRLSP